MHDNGGIDDENAYAHRKVLHCTAANQICVTRWCINRLLASLTMIAAALARLYRANGARWKWGKTAKKTNSKSSVHLYSNRSVALLFKRPWIAGQALFVAMASCSFLTISIKRRLIAHKNKYENNLPMNRTQTKPERLWNEAQETMINT